MNTKSTDPHKEEARMLRLALLRIIATLQQFGGNEDTVREAQEALRRSSDKRKELRKCAG